MPPPISITPTMGREDRERGEKRERDGDRDREKEIFRNLPKISHLIQKVIQYGSWI